MHELNPNLAKRHEQNVNGNPKINPKPGQICKGLNYENISPISFVGQIVSEHAKNPCR